MTMRRLKKDDETSQEYIAYLEGYCDGSEDICRYVIDECL